MGGLAALEQFRVTQLPAGSEPSGLTDTVVFLGASGDTREQTVRACRRAFADGIRDQESLTGNVKRLCLRCMCERAVHRIAGDAGDVNAIASVCETDGRRDPSLEDPVHVSQNLVLGILEIPAQSRGEARAGHHRRAGHIDRLLLAQDT